MSRALSTLLCWGRQRPYTVAGCVLLLVLSISFLRRDDAEWQQVYLNAADGLRVGRNIYERGQGGYVYPPFMAWASLPFLTLPTKAALGAWLVINLAALVASVRWALRLAGGGSVQENLVPQRNHLVVVLGGLCGAFYFLNCLSHRQTDVVIAAILLGGCLALARRRSFTAATCFGVAAGMKCTPLIWAPYLVWRGRPAAAAWVVAVALGINLLPDLTHPQPSGDPWLAQYAALCLRPLTVRPPGEWASDAIYNQSLAGAANRWALTTLEWVPGDCLVKSTPVTTALWPLRAAVYSAEALLLLVVLFVCWRPGRPAENEADGHLRAPLEYGIVLMLMLLLSPMSSKAHFGVLVLPGFLLARGVTNRSQAGAWITLMSSVVLALMSNKDLLGGQLYTLAQWLGHVTLQTLVLLVASLLLIVKLNDRGQVAKRRWEKVAQRLHALLNHWDKIRRQRLPARLSPGRTETEARHLGQPGV